MRILPSASIPTALALSFLLVIAGCGKSTPVPAADEPVEVEAPAGSATDALTALEDPAPMPDATPAPTVDPEWLLVPGERVGKITATTTEADLIAIYGADHVRNDEFHVGEGEMIPCTAVFPEEDAKRVMVLWDDPETKTKPVAVSVDGIGSIWRTEKGLGVGTPLTVVEELNGKPFMLYGFGWDYGGKVSDFNGGTLSTPEGGLQVEFQLNYESDPPLSEDLVNQVSGDSEFSSSNPAMKTLNPTVYSVVVGVGGA